LTPDRAKDEDIKVIATNRRARHEYAIEQTFEAGIALQGTEVKSLRMGHIDFSDGYAAVRGNEIFLIGVNIPPYVHGTHYNHEPKRERKLLMHKSEIQKLAIKVLERGYTVVPLRLYFRAGKAKVELGLAKGKRAHDKRRQIKERDMERDLRSVERISKRSRAE